MVAAVAPKPLNPWKAANGLELLESDWNEDVKILHSTFKNKKMCKGILRFSLIAHTTEVKMTVVGLDTDI